LFDEMGFPPEPVPAQAGTGMTPFIKATDGLSMINDTVEIYR
jgi:hypothetical protein